MIWPAGIFWAWLAVINLVTLLVYWHDKSSARDNRWRTSETTLHALALLGGWPAALAAQRFLRHKTAKTSFQVVFVATVLLNCSVVHAIAYALGS